MINQTSNCLTRRSKRHPAVREAVYFSGDLDIRTLQFLNLSMLDVERYDLLRPHACLMRLRGRRIGFSEAHNIRLLPFADHHRTSANVSLHENTERFIRHSHHVLQARRSKDEA